MPTAQSFHSQLVMLALLLGFALLHSGGAALRPWGEARIGARAWRLLFALLSIPAAVLLVAHFLAHRYDGLRLWNLQALPGIVPFVWGLTAVSFLFLYPATYNLLEIPALLKPELRLYDGGIIRISRHPQAVGQVLWCFSHLLWIGSSFMLAARNPEIFNEINRMQMFDGMTGSPDQLRRAIFSQQLPVADVKRYLRRMRHESQRALFDLSWPQHFWIERTDIPVQVIGAADDLFFPPSLVEETAELHGVAAEILPDMAHAVMLDVNWKQAAQHLKDWLERVLR